MNKLIPFLKKLVSLFLENICENLLVTYNFLVEYLIIFVVTVKLTRFPLKISTFFSMSLTIGPVTVRFKRANSFSKIPITALS